MFEAVEVVMAATIWLGAGTMVCFFNYACSVVSGRTDK